MVDDSMQQFLIRLGVTPEAAIVYLTFVGKSAMGAQEIASKSRIPKTTIYRRLEELIRLGLVEEQIDAFKKMYAHTSVELLSLLVTKREAETKQLREALPGIQQTLLGQLQSYDPETKVIYYRGREGIRQMLWNMLQTKAEIVGYTYRDITPFVGRAFAKDWSKEFQTTGQSARDLYSRAYIECQQETNAKKEDLWFGWSSRYIDTKTLDISHQLDIYNDVVCIYNWYGEDVFGIEIHNDKVAKLQRQLFEGMWLLGKK